ncbi:hypothetical protein V6N11_068151 [Hibiscus sabdariffa]|uniref:GH16 domain-containing protein n=1 Tax=Hibiscus sabdariffa TaxID=183260 RepID=A0ABR2STR1_9ROSI
MASLSTSNSTLPMALIVGCVMMATSASNFYQDFDITWGDGRDFHTYSILWNPQRIIFSVDGTPIREFKNMESIGVPFPKNQAMRIYFSLWNADDWATRGGLVKTDWSQAPFTVSYRNFNADACIWSNKESSCKSNAPSSTKVAWFSQVMDSPGQQSVTALLSPRYLCRVSTPDLC